jgi:hypothetical protein
VLAENFEVIIVMFTDENCNRVSPVTPLFERNFSKLSQREYKLEGKGKL